MSQKQVKGTLHHPRSKHEDSMEDSSEHTVWVGKALCREARLLRPKWEHDRTEIGIPRAEILLLVQKTERQ